MIKKLEADRVLTEITVHLLIDYFSISKVNRIDVPLFLSAYSVKHFCQNIIALITEEFL